MRYLKKFNESVRTFMTDPRYIRLYCSSRGIGIDSVSEDGTVNVNGTCYMNNFQGQNIPFRFGEIGGLDISNSFLTSLEGCPRIIKGNLIFRESEITNMIGGPEVVIGSVHASESRLTSLEGAPKVIEGDFLLKGTKISNLEGLPKSIGRNLALDQTPLTSLEGCPNFITGQFTTSKTLLTDLKGAPREISGDAGFEHCNRLTSLEGIPKKIGSNLVLNGCLNVWDPRPLRDVEIGNGFSCANTKILPLVDFFYTAHFDRFGHGRLTNLPIPGSYYAWGRNLMDSPPYRDFLDSLDYNYIRGTCENPQINQFRFVEALEELIPTWRATWDYYTQGSRNKSKLGTVYTLVDDEGNPVDIDGNRI